MIHKVLVDATVYGRIIAGIKNPTPESINSEAILRGDPWVEIPLDEEVWTAMDLARGLHETINDALRRHLGLPPLPPPDDR